MISYPSSFQSSRMSDKQNINPNNYLKVKTAGYSPCEKQKFLNLSSNKSEELFAYRTIKQNKNEVSNNSIKTLVQGFCSTIEQTQQNSQNEKFIKLVMRYYGKDDLLLADYIQSCKKDGIFNREDIYAKTQGKNIQQHTNSLWKSKNLLATDLGELIIDDLCNCLESGGELTKDQQRILEQLTRFHSEGEITSDVILQQYDIFKGEKMSEKAEISNLAMQFKNIRKQKIEQKLWSNHFRLQISKCLNYRQQKQRISFHSLCKCLHNILNQNQISTVFKYFYALETGILMPILDSSKTISIKLVRANLLREGDQQLFEVELQEKNMRYYMQQNDKKLKRFQQQKRQYLQILTNKDKQIDRLKRMIDLLQIQGEQQQKLRQTQIRIQLDNTKKAYQKKLQELVQKNESQRRMTQWYRRQLEAIMDSVNKENVMRRYLAHKF